MGCSVFVKQFLSCLYHEKRGLSCPRFIPYVNNTLSITTISVREKGERLYADHWNGLDRIFWDKLERRIRKIYCQIETELAKLSNANSSCSVNFEHCQFLILVIFVKANNFITLVSS